MKNWIFAGVALLGTVSLAYAGPPKEGTPAEVKADFELICNAVKRSGAAKEQDPSRKAQRIADYLLSHIVTKQSMRVMQSMGGMLPADKPAALRKAAADANYRGPCPFADER